MLVVTAVVGRFGVKENACYSVKLSSGTIKHIVFSFTPAQKKSQLEILIWDGNVYINANM